MTWGTLLTEQSSYKEGEMGATCNMQHKEMHKMLLGKSEGKRLLLRNRRRWQQNVRGLIHKYVHSPWCVLDTLGSRQGLVAGPCEQGEELRFP
jgi:hypothetical protein